MNLRYDQPAPAAAGGAASTPTLPPAPGLSEWRCRVCHHSNTGTACALCFSPQLPVTRPHEVDNPARRIDSVRVRPASATGGLTNAQREQSFAQRRRARAERATGGGGGGGGAASKRAGDSEAPADGWTQSMTTGTAWSGGVPTLQWHQDGTPIEAKEGSDAAAVQAQAFIRRMDSDGTLALGPAEEGTDLVGKRVPGGGKAVGVQSTELMRVAQLTLADKSEWFRAQCKLRSKPWQSGHQKIKVTRANLLLDSFRQVSELSDDKLNEVWRIEFLGEPGRDAGGLTREWFTVVSEALFSPDIGLFKESQVGGGLFSINPESGMFNEHHLEYFAFAGRFFGKALFEDERIVCPLAAPVYKHILGSPLTFADMQHVDADLHANLLALLQMDADDVEMMCLDFTVQHEFCGSSVTCVSLFSLSHLSLSLSLSLSYSRSNERGVERSLPRVRGSRSTVRRQACARDAESVLAPHRPRPLFPADAG